MAHTRKRGVDISEFKDYIHSNDYLLKYNLYNGKLNHCNPCRNPLGLIGGNEVSVPRGNLVNIESELYGITRNLSKTREQNYIPESLEIVQGTAQPRGFSFSARGSGRREHVDLTPVHLPTCSMLDIKRHSGVYPAYHRPSCHAPF